MLYAPYKTAALFWNSKVIERSDWLELQNRNVEKCKCKPIAYLDLYLLGFSLFQYVSHSCTQFRS